MNIKIKHTVNVPANRKIPNSLEIALLDASNTIGSTKIEPTEKYKIETLQLAIKLLTYELNSL